MPKARKSMPMQPVVAMMVVDTRPKPCVIRRKAATATSTAPVTNHTIAKTFIRLSSTCGIVPTIIYKVGGHTQAAHFLLIIALHELRGRTRPTAAAGAEIETDQARGAVVARSDIAIGDA